MRGGRAKCKGDFCLIPCDLSPPSYLSLTSILDRHRARPAVLSAVFYEAPESVEEEKVLVAYDREKLLLIQNVDALDETLDLRMSLLNRCVESGTR